jgi:hypothetical protein
MTPKRVIGFTGPAGAGKSTAAGLLVRKWCASSLPFARPLKTMLTAFGVPHENLYGTPEQKAEPLDLLCGHSARHAMQTLGTAWGRALGPDLWVRAWQREAHVALRLGATIVVDDVRFPNEAEAVRAMGGTIIQIVRSPAELEREPAHVSENFAALPFDHRIINDQCMHHLTVQVLAAARRPAGAGIRRLDDHPAV